MSASRHAGNRALQIMEAAFKGKSGLGARAGLPGMLLLVAVCLAAIITVTANPAKAMRIQTITSPGGIQAWLIEESRLPLIAMNFAFEGGAVQDPAELSGRADFVASMLDEGAGDLDARTYRKKLEELAIRIDFSVDKDSFEGSLQTLSANRDEAARLLNLALSKPRLDADAIARVRGQLMARLRFDAQNPQRVAARKWLELAYPSHPYAMPTRGTEASIAAIQADDLRGYIADNLARDNLKVAVVGDITPEQLGVMLDTIFGDLPQQARLKPVADVAVAPGPLTNVIEMAVPQSVAQFGMQGYTRNHPDFYTAFVINHIIGGGGFSSKLMQEVRERRGLAYSAYSYLYPLQHSGIIVGGVATRNDAIAESMSIIRNIFAQIAADGPTQEELDSAKQYLIGSYALRFDTSQKIARQLVQIQLEDLGIDYIEKRNSYIDAVTLEDARRVAADLIDPDRLLTVIVGQPEASQVRPAPTSPASPPG